MVDLETASSGTNAAILAIGAIAFNIKGPILTLEDVQGLNTFYINIELQSCLDYKLDISSNTFYWWLTQLDMARQTILKDRYRLDEALRLFITWFAKVSSGPVWSHATFDLSILSNAYEKTKIKQPYKYVNLFDVRTIKHLVLPYVPETPKDMPHHALYDAYRQAVEVQLCYERLMKNGQ